MGSPLQSYGGANLSGLKNKNLIFTCLLEKFEENYNGAHREN